jgi:DNA invertase Pin-like site-specific DNA recombinase
MTVHHGRYVAYLRVSTERQGQSGLGLEAQREAITHWLNGGRWQLVAEHVEVESGKNNNRPQLAEALAACKRHRAKLIIAKLDRLARNVHFISGLMESGVEFVAVDNPHANRLTVHILAAVAEHEREMISERTKAALAAAKARGVKLGGDRGRTITREMINAGNAAKVAQARARAADLAPTIKELQTAGYESLRAIATGLEERGIPAARGGKWSAVQVSRLLEAAASPFAASAAAVA